MRPHPSSPGPAPANFIEAVEYTGPLITLGGAKHSIGRLSQFVIGLLCLAAVAYLFKYMLLVWLAILAVVGLVALVPLSMLGYGMYLTLNHKAIDERQRLARELDQRGIVTVGPVVSFWRDTYDDTPTYYVAFLSGPYVIRQQVTRTGYESLAGSPTIPYRHLPGQPDFARLEAAI